MMKFFVTGVGMVAAVKTVNKKDLLKKTVCAALATSAQAFGEVGGENPFEAPCVDTGVPEECDWSDPGTPDTQTQQENYCTNLFGPDEEGGYGPVFLERCRQSCCDLVYNDPQFCSAEVSTSPRDPVTGEWTRSLLRDWCGTCDGPDGICEDDGENNWGAAPANECMPITHEQFVQINAASGYWPECDPSQAPKGNPPLNRHYGHWCTQDWLNQMNNMFWLIGENLTPQKDFCADTDTNREIWIRFLAQLAYETGYYSTLEEPADAGEGLIHMLEANWGPNVADMDRNFHVPADFSSCDYPQITCEDINQSTQARCYPTLETPDCDTICIRQNCLDAGLGTPYTSYTQAYNDQGHTKFFDAPITAWTSVAAWFRSGSTIPGCREDLFAKDFDEMTRCIFSSKLDRTEAYNIVQDVLRPGSERCVWNYGTSSGPCADPVFEFGGRYI